MANEGIQKGSQGRGLEEVEIGRGEKGEGVRRVRERRNRAEGRKKRKLVCPFLIIVTTCDYEIPLLTPLFCSLPTISRQYGSQESGQDEEEDIK